MGTTNSVYFILRVRQYRDTFVKSPHPKPTFTNFFQKNCSGIYAKQWNLLSVYSRETRGRKEEASPVLFWLLEKVAWKKWPSLGKNSQSKCILEKKLLNFSQLNLFFLYLIILIMKWLLKFPFFHESSLDTRMALHSKTNHFRWQLLSKCSTE